METIKLTLPDETSIEVKKGASGIDAANAISPSLAKAAVAIEVDGILQDLCIPVQADAAIVIITARHKSGLDILRHDAAHLMAQAVEILYPGVQVTIGPSTEDGFFYDFAYSRPFTPADLQQIENKMKELAKQDLPVRREIWQRDKAIEFFKSKGQSYKAQIIESIPEGEQITLYFQGDFVDLCRGPHAPSTGLVKHFKLTKTSGAYWQGDSKNEMLYRIYGTLWPSKKELDIYLERIEEAKKSDHRKLAKEMDLFHISPIAPGMVFWHPPGRAIYQVMEQYIRAKLLEHDYIEVKTPILLDQCLWEKSGHAEKFSDNMFTSNVDEKTYALKPMNCPAHVEIFKQGIKSYRDLPLRMSEFGLCHRNESSGSLHGLMRVRSFVQDDAHIFCRDNDIESETINFCKMVEQVYKDFGFEDFAVKFAGRPPVRAGSDDIWDKSEAALKNAIDHAGIKWEDNPGEGAFYGPKLEFVLKDRMGRDWQCGTLQLDFIMPGRLDASYIDESGSKKVPVMIHRAIIGTFERFMGVLLEHYKGRLPLWLAPVQIGVCSITSSSNEYARRVFEQLKSLKLRCNLDISPEKINYKVRAMELKKIPLIVAVGAREEEAGNLAVRIHGQKGQSIMNLQELASMVKEAFPNCLK